MSRVPGRRNPPSVRPRCDHPRTAGMGRGSG